MVLLPSHFQSSAYIIYQSATEGSFCAIANKSSKIKFLPAFQFFTLTQLVPLNWYNDNSIKCSHTTEILTASLITLFRADLDNSTKTTGNF